MPETATRTFVIGDRVIADPSGRGVPAATLGRVFVVDKINPRNLRCRAEDGGRGISFPPELLLPAPPEGEAIPIGRPFVEREWINEGTIVTLRKPFKDTGSNDPLIVVKGGADKVNLTAIGGAWGSKYLRMPAEGIKLRDLAWLTERLVELA